MTSFTVFSKNWMYFSISGVSLRFRFIGGIFDFSKFSYCVQSAFAFSSNSGQGILIARAEISRQNGAWSDTLKGRLEQCV